MNKKEFTKQVKTDCRAVAKSGLNLKECIDSTMCNWNMCQKEVINKQNALLTDEDRKSCENTDFAKQFACQEKLTKKKGLMDKIAMVEHCQANKCPQIKVFSDKVRKAMDKSIDSHISSLDKCLDEKCAKEKKEVKELIDLEYENTYECKKKYKTSKEQHKCIVPYGKKTNKARNKLYKCRTKHCKV